MQIIWHPNIGICPPKNPYRLGSGFSIASIDFQMLSAQLSLRAQCKRKEYIQVTGGHCVKGRIQWINSETSLVRDPRLWITLFVGTGVMAACVRVKAFCGNVEYWFILYWRLLVYYCRLTLSRSKGREKGDVIWENVWADEGLHWLSGGRDVL